MRVPLVLASASPRRRDLLAKALTRIAMDGYQIESVIPADESVDALYEYLIGEKR